MDSSIFFARTFGISEIVIGATVVSLGTTLPEVLVSLTAALQDATDMAMGNALGSIICNTAFIAGLTQLIRPSGMVARGALAMQSLFFFGSAAVLFAFALGMGRFSRACGLLLLGLFAVYVWFSVQSAGVTHREGGQGEAAGRGQMGRNGLVLVLAAVGLYLGARLLVNNGLVIARHFGLSERVIGVTIIALGTSLPELVTAITAMVRGHGLLSVGNIIGANTLNLLLVIGIPAAVRGITPSAMSIAVDLPVAVFAMAVLLTPLLLGRRGGRVQGLVLVGGYVAYCVSQFYL